MPASPASCFVLDEQRRVSWSLKPILLRRDLRLTQVTRLGIPKQDKLDQMKRAAKMSRTAPLFVAIGPPKAVAGQYFTFGLALGEPLTGIQMLTQCLPILAGYASAFQFGQQNVKAAHLPKVALREAIGEHQRLDVHRLAEPAG